MQGYSVKEAAAVLGVPTGRVWELLARGILAGTPDAAGDMRVFFQGSPAMQPPADAVPSPAALGRSAGPGNGNGGSHELSPFREVLTEFRNLTERYGQALLALGEARGEVSALRSRVELLEARLDLRLPPAPAPPVTWARPPQDEIDRSVPRHAGTGSGPQSPPMPPFAASAADAAEAEPVTEFEGPDESELPAQAIGLLDQAPDLEPFAPDVAAEATETEDLQAPERPRRPRRPGRYGRGPRVATSEFAEALARAHDPSTAELPDARPPGETRPVEEPEATDASQLRAATAVPISELVHDELLADDALGSAAEVELGADISIAGERGAAEGLATESAVTPEPPATHEVVAAEAGLVARDLGTAEEALVEGGEVPGSTAEAEPAAEDEPSALSAEESAIPEQYSEWDEPDWIAEEDIEELEDRPAERQAIGERSEAPEVAEPAAPEPSGVAEPGPPEAPGEVEPELPIETVGWADRSEMAFEDHEPAPSPEPMAPLEPIPSEPPEAPPPEASIQPVPASPPAEPLAGPPADTTTASPSERAEARSEEALMWLGDEFATQPRDPPSRPMTGRPGTIAQQASAPVTSPAEDAALARLARERGWDETEVNAIRSLLAPPVQSPVTEAEAGAPLEARTDPHAEADRGPTGGETGVPAPTADDLDWEQGPAAWAPPPRAGGVSFPGGDELDEALAAYRETSPGRADPHASGASPRRDAEQAPEQPPAESAWAKPQSMMPTPPRQADEPSAPEDDDWLRGRRGPAADAYRRLRRLFPG